MTLLSCQERQEPLPEPTVTISQLEPPAPTCLDSDCDDGDPCNGLEICSADTAQCLAGNPVLCDDGNICNGVEKCNRQTGLCDAGTTLDCDDGEPCNGIETCDPTTNACLSGEPLECDDANICTLEQCLTASGCVYENVNCLNGNTCTTEVGCNYTSDPCIGQSAPDCTDLDACTTDTCDTNTGACLHTPMDCSNTDLCQGPGLCEDGACTYPNPITCVSDCAGMQTCNPSTGLCAISASVECDDQIGCNGLETCTNQAPTGYLCTSPLPHAECPFAPPECGQSGGYHGPSNILSDTIDSAFRLYDTQSWDTTSARLDELEEAITGRVPLSTLLGDMNRQAESMTSYSPTDLAFEASTAGFGDGFSWNSGDFWVSYWKPQGISGSATAFANGVIPLNGSDKRFLAISWYHDPEAEGVDAAKGVRLSFIDISDLDNITYRHVLLVELDLDATGAWREQDEQGHAIPNFKALAHTSSSGSSYSTHAGGLAWYWRYLFVPETSSGFRVFDLEQVFKVETGATHLIGRQSTGAYHAFNYKYILPQVGEYRLCEESCCGRFSFAALDLSQNPYALISGEYSAGEDSARIFRWPLDWQSGRLVTTHGASVPEQVVYPGQSNLQGALVWKHPECAQPTYWLNASSQTLFFGKLYQGQLDAALVGHRAGYGLEDLHYDRYNKRLWTLLEHVPDRYVYYVNVNELLACD